MSTFTKYYNQVLGEYGDTTYGTFTAYVVKGSNGNLTGTWTYDGAYITDYTPSGIVYTDIDLSGTLTGIPFSSTGWAITYSGTSIQPQSYGSLTLTTQGAKLGVAITFTTPSTNGLPDPEWTFSDNSDLFSTNLPPVISIGSYTGQVIENAGSEITVTLHRSGADLSVESSVILLTSDGAANSTGINKDYISVNNKPVIFPGGQKSVTISLGSIVIDDAAVEGNENFGISISNASNASIGFSSGNITILDNDKSGTEETDKLKGTKNSDTLYGEGGNDTLDGTSGDDSINGGVGDDLLLGSTGDDTLNGGDGNDTLNGGAGTDAFIGGAGDDTYMIDSANEIALITENEGGGSDTLVIGYKNTTKTAVELNLGDTALSNIYIDNLTISGKGLYNLTGNDSANTLTGNASANLLTGNAGDDMLIGLAGNDTLLGGTGDDTLNGGNGVDSMNGGDGDDTYIVDHKNDSTIETNAESGSDTVETSISWTLGENLENLTLTGKAAIKGTGNALANLITGNTAANTITGGAGNDTINGGLGKDKLTGGADADIFVFDTAIKNNLDTITDFVHGTDTIQLSSAIFENLDVDMEGSLTSGFVSGAKLSSASGSNDRLIYDTKSGTLYYDADGSANVFKAIAFLKLSADPVSKLAPEIDVSDFLII